MILRLSKSLQARAEAKAQRQGTTLRALLVAYLNRFAPVQTRKR